jgi:hypothetical protein
MVHKLQQIKYTRQLLSDIVQKEDGNRKQKRGLFNFVGQISKALFGTKDDEDAQFYHDQIERFEQGTTTLTQLMKQQLMIVKSTLCTFNETLTDVEYNELKMREGLSQLRKYIANFGSLMENTTYLLSVKIALESHITKALEASHAVQRTLDILVDNIAEAKRGSLPPRVMSPTLLLQTLSTSIPSFPTDTTLPFQLGKDYLHLIYQFSDVRVYTYKKRLGYVISVPLVHKRTYTILRMIPIPVPIDQEHFLYIDIRNSVLCLDQPKQYYFTMTDGELSKCKSAEPSRYVCKHVRTLLSTVTTDSCAVTLLQTRDSLPPVCDTRLIRLSNTVWTQLSNNSWIFYAPHPDVITILCYDHSPIDVRLKGIGKLQIHSGCTGYSTNTLLYGSSVIGNTSMQIMGDFLSQIDLKNACCEELGVKLNLYQIPVEVTYRKPTAHLDDLRSASTRVSDLLNKVNEQEWKNHHTIYRNTHSVLLALIVGVLFICLLYKLCTLTPRWKLNCLYRKRGPTTPAGEDPVVTPNIPETAVNNGNMDNESGQELVKPTSPASSTVAHLRAATSHY